MGFQAAFWLGLALSGLARAATADEWRSRSIYQVFTDRFSLDDGSMATPCDTSVGKYCGGSWQGVIKNLDYIQSMGFTAIWISPVTDNLQQYTADLASYHGYWQQNLYELNNKFGTEDDLKALSNAVHARGMYLMFDIVVNHMAWAGNHSTVDYADLLPFNNESYYHSYCALNDSTSQTDCWLGDNIVTLADLRTEDSDVQDIFNSWISDLVSEYNVDGLRLDSAGNVNPSFFPSFCEAAGIFCTGEVYSGEPKWVCPYQEVLDSTLNYPVYFPLIRAFNSTNGSMDDLVSEISAVKDDCRDTSLLATFSENHDQPRFPSYTPDFALVQNVLAFNLLTDGIPIIYQGQEQHLSGAYNPQNREAIWLFDYNTNAFLYSYITSLNIFRNHLANTSTDYLTYFNWVVHNDTNTLAMRKGYDGRQVVTVLNNDGENGATRTLSLSNGQTGYNSSMEVTDIISCTNSTVDGDGVLEITVEKGLPNVFFPASLLAEQGFDCRVATGVKTTYASTATGTAPPTPTSTSTSKPKKSGARRLRGWGALIGLEVCCLMVIAKML